MYFDLPGSVAHVTHSIHTKIFFLVMCSAFALAILLAGMQFAYSVHENQSRQMEVHEKVEITYVPMIAHAYWHYDLKQMERLLQIIGEMPYVGQVVLKSRHDGVYAFGQDVPPTYQEQTFFDIRKAPYSRSLSSVDVQDMTQYSEGEFLGRLYVIYDKRLFTLSLFDSYLMALPLYFLFLGVFLALVLMGLGFILIKPVRHITRGVRSVDGSSLGHFIDNPLSESWANSEEIDQLFESVNTMRYSLHKQVTRQNLLQKQLEKYVDLLQISNVKLEAVFDAMSDSVIVTNDRLCVEYVNQNGMSLPLAHGRIQKNAYFLQILRRNLSVDEALGTVDMLEQSLLADQQSLVSAELAISTILGVDQVYTIRCTSFRRSDLRQSYVFLMTDVSEQRRMFRRIEFLATHDYLTEALNRFSFERKISSYLDRSGQENMESSASLFYVNIDHFRVINDSAGRIAGDELLRQFSEILSDVLSPGDQLARLEGDVFAIVKLISRVEDIARFADRVCASVSEYNFIWLNQKFCISVSTGVVLLPTRLTTVDDLLQCAHSACKKSRTKGPNKFEIYPDAMHESLTPPRHSASGFLMLEEAIQQGALKLFLEPIVPLGFGRQHGLMEKSFEVLVRIKQADGTLIYPAEFLPSAEYYGKINAVDFYVVDHLFSFLSVHQEWMKKLAYISVNVSGQSLTEEFMLRHVIPQARRLNIDPGKICFEITETVAIANILTSVTIISHMRQLGFKFSLDDFGAGFASYGYLQQLPVDYLKIDGSFVRKICDSKNDHKLVESMNAVAHHMGLKTVAEYVENDRILEQVVALQCDYAQGHYYGKARPIEDCVATG